MQDNFHYIKLQLEVHALKKLSECYSKIIQPQKPIAIQGASTTCLSLKATFCRMSCSTARFTMGDFHVPHNAICFPHILHEGDLRNDDF